MKVTLALLPCVASLTSAYWLPETLKACSFKTCIVPKNQTVDGDDSPGIMATVKNCGSNSRIVFSANTTYNLWTPISFAGLTNIEFLIDGNLTLPANVSQVEAVVGNSKLYPGHWVTVTNSQGVTFTGTEDNDGGWWLGHGDLWWPDPNTSNNNARPHFFSFKVTSLRLRRMKIFKPVAWCFSISGSDVYMTDTILDARSDNGFPFNTDGIDMSASNAVVDGWTSWNGDDIINVAPPATNVTMRNIIAYGTHGVSVSCSGGTGGDYLFENALIYDSLIGARFKGVLGTTCDVLNVTWRNFAIFNTSYPIHFIESYVDQEKGPPKNANLSLAAFATNFVWENIVATTAKVLADGSCISSPCWSFTPGESSEKGLYLLCKDQEHCKDFHMSHITLLGAVSFCSLRYSRVFLC
jgi:galacturan 1,4-alpha-galacturonidase